MIQILIELFDNKSSKQILFDQIRNKNYISFVTKFS